MSLFKQLVRRGTSASQNVGEQRGLTSNMVHSKLCHDVRWDYTTYINFFDSTAYVLHGILGHREVGYIHTALCSQHYIILTQWVSFQLPGINFFGILQSLRHKSWLTERKKDADSWLKATEPTDRVCLDPTPIHFTICLTGSISHRRTELSCRQVKILLTFHGQMDIHNWDQQAESWIFNTLLHTSKESILKQQTNLVI